MIVDVHDKQGQVLSRPNSMIRFGVSSQIFK
jgi:hypothetical protein